MYKGNNTNDLIAYSEDFLILIFLNLYRKSNVALHLNFNLIVFSDYKNNICYHKNSNTSEEHYIESKESCNYSELLLL